MKKIVIIGGGFAGSYAAKKLEKKFDLTLIDSKDYFEFTPSILRIIVKPEHFEKIQIKHKEYLKNTKLILGKVSILGKGFVQTNIGEKHFYDYLIIASGSSYNKPIKDEGLILADRTEELIESTEKLREADSILIIGGGLVGIELAAEIIETFPKKKVTLVQANKELIPRNNKRTRVQCKNYLEKKGVKIIFNCKAKSCGKGEYLINNERKKYDLSFSCIGINPNSDFINKKMLDERGFVIVNDYMQVIGKEKIFSVGDVNNLKAEKTAQVAELQAKVVVNNILNLEKQKQLNKYFHEEKPLVISLGKKHGILTYKKISYFGLIPGILKSLIEIKAMRR
jgi:apoptosis-inducing factor 2